MNASSAPDSDAVRVIAEDHRLLIDAAIAAVETEFKTVFDYIDALSGRDGD